MGGGVPGITHTNPTSIPDDPDDLAAGKVCTQTHWMGAYSTSHSMSGILGWQLVQQSIIPSSAPVSSLNISSLNGNADLEYKIEMDVVILASGADSYIYLQPNGLSTNISSRVRFDSNTGGGVTPFNYSYIRLACAFYGKNSYAWGEWNIKALSGILRRIKGKHQCINADLSHISWRRC